MPEAGGPRREPSDDDAGRPTRRRLSRRPPGAPSITPGPRRASPARPIAPESRASTSAPTAIARRSGRAAPGMAHSARCSRARNSGKACTTDRAALSRRIGAWVFEDSRAARRQGHTLRDRRRRLDCHRDGFGVVGTLWYRTRQDVADREEGASGVGSATGKRQCPPAWPEEARRGARSRRRNVQNDASRRATTPHLPYWHPEGFSQFNRRLAIHDLRDRLRLLGADVVFLQEVQGMHLRHAQRRRLAGQPSTSSWPATCGSRPPTAATPSTTTATTATPSCPAIHPLPGQPGRLRPPLREPRPAPTARSRWPASSAGALRVRAPGPHRRQPPPPDGRHRRPPRPARPGGAPLIIAGDFNDWRNHADDQLTGPLGLSEVFTTLAAGRRAASRAPCRCCASTASTCAASRSTRPRCITARLEPHLDHAALTAHLRSAWSRWTSTGCAATPSPCSRTAPSSSPALETAIDGATREIFVETYIFANDEIGHRIAAALGGPPPGGVRALLVDGFGGRDFVDACWRPRRGGVNVLIYRRGWRPCRCAATACAGCTARSR